MRTDLEEEPDDEHLESSHTDDKTTLDHAEVLDSLLCAPDGAEVSVLASTEVLLVTSDGRQLARNLVDGLFQCRCNTRIASFLGRQVHASFVLNLSVMERMVSF